MTSPTNTNGDLATLAALLGHNWLLLVMGIVVSWLVITRIVETSEAAAKVLGPLGRRIVNGYRRRQAQYRHDVAAEAKLIATELVPKVMPDDYGVVKRQLTNVISRVTDLEIENIAMRAFIVFDAEWHFQDELVDASLGKPRENSRPRRIPWEEFLEKWREGWRPPGLL